MHHWIWPAVKLVGVLPAERPNTSEFSNPNYHRQTDTPDSLDYEFMAEVGKVLVMVVE